MPAQERLKERALNFRGFPQHAQYSTAWSSFNHLGQRREMLAQGGGTGLSVNTNPRHYPDLHLQAAKPWHSIVLPALTCKAGLCHHPWAPLLLPAQRCCRMRKPADIPTSPCLYRHSPPGFAFLPGACCPFFSLQVPHSGSRAAAHALVSSLQMVLPTSFSPALKLFPFNLRRKKHIVCTRHAERNHSLPPRVSSALLCTLM